MSLLKLYDHFEMDIDRAEGIHIYTADGDKYLDTFSGIGVLSLGHSDKNLKQVFINKLERYTHLSNFFIDKDAEYVAEKLIAFTGRKGKVFYSNSGTEANEAVLKTIRKISDKEKCRIIFFDKGFHGRTTGTLSVTGFPKIRDCFNPLLQQTVKLPFNDPDALQNYLVKNNKKVAGIFVEAIQGSGGVVPLTDEFAAMINQLHEKYNFTLVCDEIQAGLGRSGKMFSFQHFGLQPDLITVAKSLGGGLPLGAILFMGNYADILKPGEHGSTFAPNPVSLAGARYIVDNIQEMLSDINKKSDYFFQQIKALNCDKIMDIRGKGLMLAIELKQKDDQLRKRAFEHKLLLNVIKGKIIRLLPALNINFDEIDTIVTKIGEII
ncbi:MAG: aspartate aminotransferase family protein [Fidelibacterota bacterium]